METISLSKVQHERAVNSIIAYFATERDEEIGALAAELLLRHFMETIGPSIFNLGLDTAHQWLTRRIEDLDVDYGMLRMTEAE